MAVQSDDQAVSRQDGAVAPGPRGLPVIGSAISLLRDVRGFMLRGMHEYGDVVHVTAGPPPTRVHAYGIFHPDGVQHVLANNADNYFKGDQVYAELIDLLGNGLLTSEGEVWKRQKRLVQPLFTHKRVAAYVPMMAEEADGIVARWRAAAERGETVDLHSEMTRVTLRVVGRAVFGTDVDHMLPIFKDSVPYLSKRAFQRGLLPVRIPSEWPTPGNRRANRYKSSIYAVVDDLIASRRRNPTESDDLVNLLLRAQDPEGGQGLSDQEVRDQALIFLMAGHETTATSLTFTFHLVGHHPDVQRRVHEEVDAVLTGRPLTLEDVRALAYTTMVIKEAMRLYPAAHATARTPVAEDWIGGYRIPAQTSTVVVSPWVTHRHPKFWDDPERFDPERFTPEAEKARHRYAYFPFGGGPRACIGSYFSMLEAAIVTAVVMRAFDITTDPAPVPLFTGITLRPEGAMPAKVTPR